MIFLAEAVPPANKRNIVTIQSDSSDNENYSNLDTPEDDHQSENTNIKDKTSLVSNFSKTTIQILGLQSLKNVLKLAVYELYSIK